MPEGLQEPKVINKGRPGGQQVDFEQVAEKRQAASQAKNDTNLAKAEWCIQEHTAQRKVDAVEEQQKLVKKSWEDQTEALTEIHVEENMLQR